MNATYIIKRPLISEKSTWEASMHNRYSFEVADNARKPDIRRAVEELYDVRVVKVATQNRRGKTKRTRYGIARGSDWKRAMVQLHEDDRIELY